jgi:hypothetical protein
MCNPKVLLGYFCSDEVFKPYAVTFFVNRTRTMDARSLPASLRLASANLQMHRNG